MSSTLQKILNLKKKSSLQELTPTPPPKPTALTPRRISLLFPAQPTPEGSGVIVHRSIGSPSLHTLTPFLMLDHAVVPTANGFPDHPHRGISTISYILSGSLLHEDFAGNSGILHAGDLQFMTAGRGIMHSEMPLPSDKDESGETQPNEGLQLWVDLPVGRKMCEPRYRDLRSEEIPVAGEEGVQVKVINGVSYGVENVRDVAYTPVWYLDFILQPGAKVRQGIPTGWNAFLYIISGTLDIVDGQSGEWKRAKKHDLAALGRDESGDSFGARVGVGEQKEARFIFVAGQPLDQGVAQYGPFVMTTREEIMQARSDWARCENGFERARNWESKAEKRRRSLC
ncbi:hypothetical protein T440DRAFT_501041 [Plenodomus tracheiphilus IPT5]|uniref:RmlC-like cupin n=1 Tax=Plenodomus tracheiphilus IPT5 TaxID=1408161 RepID=A0A6A7AWH8_9PLEO|nr:hypothetical protein T440DRAFT_501041 [Plenodomus tracheiphilus IPT5]